MARYNIYNKGSAELFKNIVEQYKVDEVLARIMVNRDVPYETMGEYLHPDITKIYNPYQLKDAKTGASIIKEAVSQGKKIRIIGDYDIDGVMSTYILMQGMTRIGANVDYQIPHRVEDGYGLNVNIINRAIDDKVDLIVTCDNGVAAPREIQLARDNGIDVIVTDHHEVMFEEVDGVKRELLPNANAVINPKREEDEYPFKKLCGAAVAWKLVLVLYDIYDIISLEEDAKYQGLALDAEGMELLENVAFATIGDVMELVDENRTIVSIGLDALSRTMRTGMRALINHTIPDTTNITSYHVGFILGPCINASGRLDSASKSLELLLSTDSERANNLATELVSLNEERKAQTTQGVERAFDIVDNELMEDDVLVIYIPDVHESIAGIIAGKVKEKYYKPVLVLCDSDGCVKGSGRSIEAYNMYEELHNVQELFIKFGGHPMAAGLSIDKDNVNELRRRLNENCTLTETDLTQLHIIDMTIGLEHLSLELVDELELLEPFGNGNKKPLFALKNAHINSIRRIGKDKQFFKFTISHSRGRMDALYFGDANELETKIIKSYGNEEYMRALAGGQNSIAATIMFYPQINEYRGERSVQIVLQDMVI